MRVRKKFCLAPIILTLMLLAALFFVAGNSGLLRTNFGVWWHSDAATWQWMGICRRRSNDLRKCKAGALRASPPAADKFVPKLAFGHEGCLGIRNLYNHPFS
jgi:hypothetical protein